MFLSVKTCTRTSYSLWMLVAFGDDLRFLPMFLLALANLQYEKKLFITREE